MADKQIYLRVKDQVTGAPYFWPWPTNSLGRPLTAIGANTRFQQRTSNVGLSTTMPDGGTEPSPEETESLQGVTNQGLRTSDFLITEGYTQDQFARADDGEVLLVANKRDLQYYNNGTVRVERAEAFTWGQAAEKIRPFLNSTTPSPGPTVLNAIPDRTITEVGDQSFSFADNTFSGNNTYSATKEDGSVLPISLSNRTFTVPAPLPNQTIRVKVIATSQTGLTASTVFTLTVARVVIDAPYLLSIKRKFDPANQTVYYVLKSSYQGSDVSKLPVWRAKSLTVQGSTWNSSFGPTLTTENVFDDFNAGYREYAYGVLGGPGTTSVFQFKPYPDAPDSTILEFSYTQGSVPDFGTVVFTYTVGSSKIKGLWVQRYQDSDPRLSVYADGSGVLTLTLAAKAGTPAYVNGTKVMSTSDGPYANSVLFTGSVPYGALYFNVPNGQYTLTIKDEEGKSLSYDLALTNNTPVTALKASEANPGSGGTDPVIPSDPGSGSSDTGITTVETANRDLLAIDVQWSGGKARLVHTNKPSSGSYLYILSGQNEIAQLPATYDFNPGDEVVVDFVKGSSSSQYFFSDWGVGDKAQAIIQFRQPS